MLSIKEIRQHFPALKREYKGMPVAYLDGPGGTQVADCVMEAMVNYMSNGVANLHGEFPTSQETEKHIENARIAIADFFNASPKEVAFGQNATSLMFSIARALSKIWSNQDNIVVSEIDHHANIDSWVTSAKDTKTEVRFIPVDTKSLTLDLSEIDRLIDEKTKLVAVTMASNAVGTITDIERIAERAHAVGALLVVDTVQAAPHLSIDFAKMGADVIFGSAYKFFGPHIGVAVIKEKLFEQLSVYKLQPAPTYYPDKLETGTQNHEAIASLDTTINFIASLGKGESRRKKIQNALFNIEEHENQLANKLRVALANIPEVTLYQAPDGVPKTATVAFTIKGADSAHVCKWVAENFGVFIASGDFYATILADKIGINKTGGWIRAGFSPYNTVEETDRLIRAIHSYVEQHVTVGI